jgi:hypothetical protein
LAALPFTQRKKEMANEQDQTQKHAHDEFERQPVPQKSLLGLRDFIGMYAGEHCAGTELMIGPLFVAKVIFLMNYFNFGQDSNGL